MFRQMFGERADWYALPLRLRRRWWRETDFNVKPPGELLRQAVEEWFETDYGVRRPREQLLPSRAPPTHVPPNTYRPG